jgi:hypothetical protein
LVIPIALVKFQSAARGSPLVEGMGKQKKGSLMQAALDGPGEV